MGYKKLLPSKILQPYVESIWIQEDLSFDPDYPATRIIPTNKIDLIFYYHEPFAENVNGAKEIIPLNVLHGQQTRPMHVSATGKTGIIIFSFYPWGLYPFTDEPINEFVDKSVDMSLIFGSNVINELHSRILESKCNLNRVNLIEEFLIKLLNENKRDYFITNLVNQINNSNGNINISEVARLNKMSRRNLQRRFTKTIGITPKKFADIIRFQKALFYKKSGYNWSDIAEFCGYYDQPHFIKEMKNFTGLTPDKIFSNIQPTRLMNYFNKPKALSHFYNTIYL